MAAEMSPPAKSWRACFIHPIVPPGGLRRKKLPSPLVQRGKSRFSGSRKAAAERSGRLRAVDLVRPLLKRGGEAAERGIEHRAHQQTEGAAAELVGNEKRDVAGAVACWREGPAIAHALER